MKEPKCTCEEMVKQRALCPVCDKEKYDRIANLAHTMNDKHPTPADGQFEKELDFLEDKIEDAITADPGNRALLSAMGSVSVLKLLAASRDKENEALKERIKELESSNIVFSQTIAIEPVTDTEGANRPGC